MASNSRRRSASSGSRQGSARSGAPGGGSSVKGRPTQGRSVQISQQGRNAGVYSSPSFTGASSRSKTGQSVMTSRTSGPRGRGGVRSSAYIPNPVSPMPGTNYGSGVNAGRGRSAQNNNVRGSYGNNGRYGGATPVAPARKQVKEVPVKKGLPTVAKVAIFLAIIALIAGVIIYTFINSDSYRITSVQVEGSTHLTNEELTALANIPENSTLLNIDENAIISGLKQDPWVADVRVERNFPNTLKLVVTERTIAAICDVVVDDSDTTQTWALASDGMWLMRIPDKGSAEAANVSQQIYNDVDSVLRITGVPYGTTPVAGEICSNSNISNALGVIDGMTTELADQVKKVTASNSDSTTLTLNNGIEIVFGDSSDIREKERVCLQLMEEYPDKIAYINVRAVNKPVWRSL